MHYYPTSDRTNNYFQTAQMETDPRAWMHGIPNNGFNMLCQPLPQTPIPAYTTMAQLQQPARMTQQSSMQQTPLVPQHLPASMCQIPDWDELMVFDPFYDPFALNTPDMPFNELSHPLYSPPQLSPETSSSQPSRNASTASNASKPCSRHSYTSSITSTPRSLSPDPPDSAQCGFVESSGLWRCGWPGCASPSRFERVCDLRKHYKRHYKVLCCRYPGCPKAGEAGFSNKKDRARHEAKHNPEVVCEWVGCPRVFSRVDNMRDHMRRVHHLRMST